MENMEWITVKEVAQRRKCSERNILRLIKAGKLEGKKDDGGHRWLVKTDSSEMVSEESPTDTELMSVLKAQLQEKDKQIERLQVELQDVRSASEDSRKRSDTIILQLTQQNQLMLEDKTAPWWQRWFKRRTLRTPSDVMDMEAGIEEAGTPERE